MNDTTRTEWATGSDASRPAPEELLERVARGDQEAFEELYPVLAGRALGLARRVVRDEMHAEEVCREALLEVWRSAGHFDPAHGGAVSWAMTITHRRAVDRVRSTRAAVARDDKTAMYDRRPVPDSLGEEGEDGPEAEDGPEGERVRRYLLALTPLQRESVLLAYYDGCTYRETAERLGTAPGAITTRMRDGLIRLRDGLQPV